ncbi:MAG: dNTP triphosphohydrolase [Armatimonadetes bacterium]|nr:dNTP triphosphohydrolase [Akkermansiaceae bacterium]
MDWPRLLSPKRFPDTSSQIYIRARPPWQQDYDRLVFCSAFRRLQDKTQVHPLSGSDYVRTRLTHSLEVSSVARSLGTLAGNHILEKHGRKKYQQSTLRASLTPLDVGMISSAAALAHDIGNPPFGHSGEDAIRYWFATSAVAAKVKLNLTDSQILDFESWEGNAEGFRLLSRLQMSRDQWGMRLTAATLGSFMKYPISSKAFVADRSLADESNLKQEIARKKPGIFRHDLELWREVASELGLPEHKSGEMWPRHPIAFLTEAADDICYRIVDLEDGFRLGRVTFAEFRDRILPLFDKGKRSKVVTRLREQHDEPNKASYLRAMAIGELIRQVDEAFRANEEALLNGTMKTSLLKETIAFSQLDKISDFTRVRVYSAPNVLQIEAAGFEIISGLLDLFVGTLEALSSDESLHSSLQAKKLAQLMPRECFGPKGRPTKVPYVRLLDAVDFVAGMTDTFALDLFRKIRGVTIPR